MWEAEGNPARDSGRPLAADIQEADRTARRMADYHPDPRARRIYRQLVEHVEEKREQRSYVGLHSPPRPVDTPG